MLVSNYQSTKILDNLNLLLIYLLPVALIVGSLVINIFIILIILIFLITLNIRNEFYLLKNKLLYFSGIILVYLIFCSSINFENFNTLDKQSIIRSIGFYRHVLLSFALGYYIKKLGNEKIVKIWSIFFLIVIFDLIVEMLSGSNLLGYKSSYHGRLAGFTGDELKIGGYFFGFVFLTLAFIYKRKKNLLLPSAILFLVISLLIGERANFLKVFIIILTGIFLIDKSSLKKKLGFSLITALICSTIFLTSHEIKGRFFYEIFKNKPENSFFENIKSNRHAWHYTTSVKIFKDYPFFGVGLKKFRKISHEKKYNKFNYGYGGSIHPHQFHFEWLAEAGIIGYILFLSFFFYSIIKGFKEYIINKNIFLLSSILFLIVSLIPFIPSGSFFTTYGATIFWINFGFLIGNSKILNSDKIL